ncbi:hypothetical protein COC46_18495 [Bacillus sp. AFS041924]|nr:hypothetical protein COC46_18495 [Bacillus sp. AFS041924]
MNENLILTTSNDQWVRFWKLDKDIELVGEYYIPGNCYSFSWDGNGKFAFADSKGKIHFVRHLNELQEQ